MPDTDIKALYSKAQNFAFGAMPKLGPNKQRELLRLIFEICKRGNLPPDDVLPLKYTNNFEQAKTYLLKKRYPKTYGKTGAANFYLPKLDLDFLPQADISKRGFEPENIFVEEDVSESKLALRARALFPKAKITIIKPKEQAGSADYSGRKNNLVIIKERFDFLKPCPCTSNANCCGYNLVNLGFGCVYDCHYCFLQQYQNLHAIVLPANIEDFLEKIKTARFNKGIFPYIRIGSGEFTDSLLFDDITQYSANIVNFFRGREEYFEFKTKSANIANLLKIGSAPNIVIGWSVNPLQIIKESEPLTASLEERLNAAAQVAAHGYKTAFHFDPVILHDNWKQNYADVVEQISQKAPSQSIMWFSIGTLRFNRELKKFIESRFLENTILDEEFALDFDGKMRYEAARRKEVYQYLGNLLRQKFPKAFVYFCMERM